MDGEKAAPSAWPEVDSRVGCWAVARAVQLAAPKDAPKAGLWVASRVVQLAAPRVAPKAAPWVVPLVAPKDASWVASRVVQLAVPAADLRGGCLAAARADLSAQRRVVVRDCRWVAQ